MDSWTVVSGITKWDVEGGFCASDYIERHNVLFEDGKLMSEEWFDKVIANYNGYFKVIQNGQMIFVDYSGRPFLPHLSNLICYDGNMVYYCNNGELFKTTKSRLFSVKKLKPFVMTGRFRIGRRSIVIKDAEDLSLLKQILSEISDSMIVIENLESEMGGNERFDKRRVSSF